MKKIWMCLFWGLLAVVIVLGLIVTAAHSQFHEQGVNISGDHALISVQQDCYLIENGTFTVKSTLCIEGYLWDQGKDQMHDFYGFANLTTYPAITEDNIENFSGSIDGDFITLTNQSTVLLDQNWKYFYTVHLVQSDPEVIVVSVNFHDGRTIMAVCGNSEENAIENYETYLKHLKEHFKDLQG